MYPVLSGPMNVLGGVLRSLERPDGIFWAYLVSSLLTITIGLILLAKFGVFGASTGLIIASIGTVTTMIFILRAHIVIVKPHKASI